MPPSSALATPTPMNQVPSVVMKEGTFRRTWMTPLAKPTPAPTSSTTSTASMPRSLPFAPFRTSIDRMTAPRVSTPFDGQVDRPHQDDECRPEAEHERDHRRLADAHEIAEAEKVGVDGGDDRAQQDEHDERRPRGDAPAPDALDRLVGRQCLGCGSGQSSHPLRRHVSSTLTVASHAQAAAQRAEQERRGRACRAPRWLC